jgi:hypothetical protein
MKKKFINTIVILFVLLSIVVYVLHQYLPAYSFAALMGGNILMAVLSLSSFLMVTRQMQQKPQAFVRAVYAGTFSKMLVCMFAILIYVMVNRNTLYKPLIFVLFGIYIVYTVAETSVLSKTARDTKQ